MALDQILVTLFGLLLAGGVAWYFWFSEATGTRLQATAGGIQETLITVKGGYAPDVIVVEAGKPVRLNFRREETAACSEQVLFPDFNKRMLRVNRAHIMGARPPFRLRGEKGADVLRRHR